jgi:hypothetical protein
MEELYHYYYYMIKNSPEKVVRVWIIFDDPLAQSVLESRSSFAEPRSSLFLAAA